MLISFAWLRELVAVPDDPAEVARRLTSRGLTVDAITTIDGDTVLDIDVPANRPDALGHRGVAREAGAAFGLPLTARDERSPERRRGPLEGVAVVIDDPALCLRYTAGLVGGVRVGPSPAPVSARLAACGVRSINNVVDASNLVMLELGQPVHFFDAARVRGGIVRVRGARAGERMTTLDGVERTLAAGMIVIADGAEAIALGGVMGGAGTQVTDATTSVLVEAASFVPSAVRRTARGLGMSTDASQRFERGCDLEAPAEAQRLAARLLADLAGGQPAAAPVDVRSAAAAVRGLSVRLPRASRVLGYSIGPDDASAALAPMGLCPRVEADVVHVTVPSWRVDLEREADLIEEIGRHLGYDRIPSRAPVEARVATSSRLPSIEERVRDRLAGLGFNEAVTYAMIGPGEDRPFAPAGAAAALAIANPIAETLGLLRRSLIPGLIRAADQNLRRGVEDVRLFEVGAVFHPRGPGELPHEPAYAGFVWGGRAHPPHWSGTARPVDAWDVAGLVEDVLAIVAPGRELARRRGELAGFHPGRSFRWLDREGVEVARAGALHPDVAATLGSEARLWLGEIDVHRAAHGGAHEPRFAPIPSVPSAWRDLSIVLPAGVAAGEVVAALGRVPSPAPATLTWIDRYEGPPLAPGDVAMTLRVILQPLDHTLTDVEAERYREALAAALDTVPGARLRRTDG
jgi:phenylalanyl-tRNA synthetase beta chain